LDLIFGKKSKICSVTRQINCGFENELRSAVSKFCKDDSPRSFRSKRIKESISRCPGISVVELLYAMREAFAKLILFFQNPYNIV